MQQDELERQAQDAIARGADPAAVRARLDQLRSQQGNTPLRPMIPARPAPRSAEQIEADVLGNIQRRQNIAANERDADEPRLTPAQEAVDGAFADEYVEWRAQGGSADYERQLNQLRGIRDRLRSGENMTGTGIGNTPDFLGTAIFPDAVDAREQVEEVVQRNLRLILGAQFTEREGERLISRAFNPRLSEAQNADRLDRLITQMERAAQARNDAADYYEQNGTLVGWEGSLATASSFDPENDVPAQSGNREYGEALNRLGEQAGVNEDRTTVSNPFSLYGSDTGPNDNSDQIRRHVAGMMQGRAPADEIRRSVNSIFGVNIPLNDAGLSYYERTGENPGINVEAVDAPPGTDLGDGGTAALSALDAATLNTGSAIASQTNPDAYAALQNARDDSPLAAFFGDTTGYIGTGIGGGALARSIFPHLANSRLASYGANIAEGSIVGQNTASDPVAGGFGGLLGRFIGGRVASPNRAAANPDALAMNDAGIRLTPGQVLGGAPRRFEDAASGVPVFNAQLIARQREGLGDFNRAVVNDALEPIGVRFGREVEAGNDLMARAQSSSGDAFNVLDNFSGTPDRQLATSLTDIRSRVGQMPDEYRNNFEALWNDDIGYLVNNSNRTGPITGREMQSIRQTLNRELSRVEGPNMSPIDRRYADAVREARDGVQSWVGRVDPEIAEGYANANRAWESMRSVNRGASASVEDGPFTPAQYLRGIRTEDGRDAFAAGTGRQSSGQRFAQQAQGVLPNTVPNSGTTERAIASAMLGGSAAGAPVLGPLAAIPLAGAAAMSSPARGLFQRTVMGAPGRTDYGPVRDFIRQRALAGSGLLGAAGTVGLLGGY